MGTHGAKAVSLALILCLGAQAAGPAAEPQSAIRFGTTFPYRQLRQSGRDWQEALDAADALGLKVLRIGAYWDEIEPKQGRFEFGEIEDLLTRAQAKGYQVIVTVGMKAPSWPEYYIPGWALPECPHAHYDAEVSKDPKLRRRALTFVRRAVIALSRFPSIVAWQVENEPMDRAGPDRWFIGADFVKSEARLIRMMDPWQRPLIISAWAEDQRKSSEPWGDATYALRHAVRSADILGVNVYPKVQSNEVSLERAVEYPELFRHTALDDRKEAWIIESQAEQWLPGEVSPDDIRWLVDRHREQGYVTILLWGFQTWYEQRLAGDPALWDAIGEIARGPTPDS